MIIKDAQFLVSNTDVRKCPEGTMPEFAFIGRSNVGKSSLINMLTNRKGLAMTSSTPGKTMLINHFIINNDWYLVDLPGYGYARRGKEGREQIRTVIENYIQERMQLTCLFVLIDSRLEPQQIDLEFIEWLGENGVPDRGVQGPQESPRLLLERRRRRHCGHLLRRQQHPRRRRWPGGGRGARRSVIAQKQDPLDSQARARSDSDTFEARWRALPRR